MCLSKSPHSPYIDSDLTLVLIMVWLPSMRDRMVKCTSVERGDGEAGVTAVREEAYALVDRWIRSESIESCSATSKL